MPHPRNPKILEFIQFVNKLPLTDSQKVDFVNQQIALAEAHAEGVQKNKKLFNQVLKDIRSEYL